MKKICIVAAQELENMLEQLAQSATEDLADSPLQTILESVAPATG